jgi:hypothetical protein
MNAATATAGTCPAQPVSQETRMTAPRLLAFVLACCAGSASQASTLADQCLGRAPRLAESLAAHDYAAANQQLGMTMRLMFSSETLRMNWEGMLHDDGAYQSHGKPWVAEDDGKDAFIRIDLTFARKANAMQIVCSRDAHDQISSLAFF